MLASAQGATFIGSDVSGTADLPEAEFLEAPDMGDLFHTTNGNDTVNAGGDSDWITDHGGADQYNGGAGGTDLVSYSAWRNKHWMATTGIVADLGAGTVTGPDGFVDRLTSIEGIRGTQFADILRGSAGNNFFVGGPGRDTIEGRGGNDTAFYFWDQGGGINANLTTGVVRDGVGGRDRLTSIETVVGTRWDDVFVDAAGAQRFEGRDGADHFTFGKGNDTALGGEGADTFKFVNRDFGTGRILDFENGADVIHLTGASRFGLLNISSSAGNLVIGLGTSKVVLVGMGGTSLDASDFLFG